MAKKDDIKLVYLVQGSSPEPYMVVFKPDPFSISCTCTAGVNGIPCKHRLTILAGADPGIIEGDKSFLPRIAEMVRHTNLSEILESYESIKKERQNTIKRTDYAFKNYKKERILFSASKKKDDRNLLKAREKMEESINQEIADNAQEEDILKALRGVFIRPGKSTK
jgi:predicted DNA-binding protein YlxM (UPF0122 family)